MSEQQDTILKIIGEQGANLLKEEIAILNDLKKLSSEIAENSKEHIGTLDTMLANLDELFLLVIVGEVKAGKSSFINTLFGKKICKEGVTPVTDKIHILRYGAEEKMKDLEPFIVEHTLPFEPLRNINVVDTPGTNSLILEHQKITERFIPRSDLVLFITSIDRPFTESERQLLSYIKDSWGKKIIFVLNKIDIKQPEEVAEVTAFIKENANKLLSFDPIIFPTSGKLAFESKMSGDKESWEKSRFETVEHYIFKVLSHLERLKLKLSGPLFTSLKISEKLLAELTKKFQVIDLDKDVVSELNKVISYEEKMMHQAYGNDVTKLELTLKDMEKWGRDFFDDNIQLANLKLMLKKKQYHVLMDQARLGPIFKLLEQNMEKALKTLFTSTRSLWEQVYDGLQKKFKTPLCVAAYSKEERERIKQIFSDVMIREMQETIHHQMDTIQLAEECKAILTKTYKMLLYLGGGTAALVLLGFLNIFAASYTLKFIGLLLIGGSIFAMAKFIPTQKKLAVNNFSTRVQKMGEELKWQMERFFQRECEFVLTPLKQAVSRRDELIAQQKNTLDQKKASVEAIQNRASTVQNDLKNLTEQKL